VGLQPSNRSLFSRSTLFASLDPRLRRDAPAHSAVFMGSLWAFVVSCSALLVVPRVTYADTVILLGTTFTIPCTPGRVPLLGAAARRSVSLGHVLFVDPPSIVGSES
jgi:hypothetical protein